MARHKSAMKQLRSSQRKQKQRIQIYSKLKTLVKNVNESLATDDKEKSKENLKTAISNLQRAASKKIIHKNTASRKISRLMKKSRKTAVTV
jgi:small subunit ribosomal protein S20